MMMMMMMMTVWALNFCIVFLHGCVHANDTQRYAYIETMAIATSPPQKCPLKNGCLVPTAYKIISSPPVLNVCRNLRTISLSS